MKQVIKRDGKSVKFNLKKIVSAIRRAGESSGEFGYDEALDLTNDVIQKFDGKEEASVEEIQDAVEDVLSESGYKKTAKAYILYREQHSKLRNDNVVMVDAIKSIDDYLDRSDWRVNANANQGYSLGGMILNTSGKVTANYWLSHVYPKEAGDGHRNGDIQIHDLDMLSSYTYSPKEVVVALIDDSYKLISFEDLYDLSDAEEVLEDEINGVWCKYPDNIQVLDRGGVYTYVTRLTKKVKHRDLVRIKTYHGEDLVVTDNHPLIINDDKNKTIEAISSEGAQQFRDECELTFKGKTEVDLSSEYPDVIEKFDTFFTTQPAEFSVIKTVRNPIKINRELGYLVGFFIGDGNYVKYKTGEFNGALVFTQKDKSTLKNLAQIAYDLTGATPVFIKKEDSSCGVNCWQMSLTSPALVYLFHKFFGIKHYAKNKCLPINLLDFNKDFAIGIIEGLIDSDGTVHGDTGNSMNIRVSSRTLVLQLAVLLRSLGFIAGGNHQFCAFGNNDKIKQKYDLWGVSFSRTENAPELTMSYKASSVGYYEKRRDYKKGWANITTIKVLDDKTSSIGDNFIYDITTESETLIVNGLWCHNCTGWSLRSLLQEGFNGVPGKVESNPPKHLGSALGQMVNFWGCLQNENAGAQAFSSFDTYLAPYVRNDKLTYKQVYDAIQEFVFNVNVPSRWGCVLPYTEILTKDGWKKYSDLKISEDIVGFRDGELVDDVVNKINEFNFEGKLVKITTSSSEQVLTPTHRVIGKGVDEKFYTVNAEDLFTKRDLKLPVLCEDLKSVKYEEVESVEWYDYEGKVWCPSTDCTYWVAKNGSSVFITGNTQTPFTNLTFDWTCPEDLKDSQPIIAGEEMDYTYSELQPEMDMINKAFIEVMMKGDAKGRLFTFPIPTYNITPDFPWESENTTLLFEMTAKYGLPYFQNFLNSDLKVGDVRSMCPLTGDTEVLVKEGDKYVDMSIENMYNAYINDNTKTFNVWDGNKWCKAKPNCQGEQEYLKISLANGSVINLGKNHLQCLVDGRVKFASELEPGDRLPLMNMSSKAICDLRGKSSDIPVTFIEESKEKKTLYCLEVDNDNHLFTLSNGILTHNCRLQLDLREIRKRGGGLFGSGEQTGSVGVITINCARLGYLFKGDLIGLYKQLDHWMEVAKNALEQKRKVLVRWMEQGLYPYSKRYLGTYNTLFSTIGINGVNEMIRNFTNDEHDITDDYGQNFAIKLMDHMRDVMVKFQVETGNLYNLEATPAEGCFAYDTEVMTTEGVKKIGEIVGREDLGVLSYNEKKHKREFRKATCIHQTGVKKVLKVTFDNGQELICTPNHPFGVRSWNGKKGEYVKYVEAQDLKEGMRVKSAYKEYHGDFDNGRQYVVFGHSDYLHRMIWEYYNAKDIPEGYVVHHKDFNRDNNDISNLELMSSTDHKSLHLSLRHQEGDISIKTMSGENNPFYGKTHSDETKEKISKNRKGKCTGDSNYCRTEEGRKRMSEIAKSKTSEQCSHYKHGADTNVIINLFMKGKSVAEIAKELGGVYTYSLCKGRLQKAGLLQNNHIVKSVEQLDIEIPVYNMEVEENHNYFVGGEKGILVHNCTYRFAKEDSKRFSDIIQAGNKEAPYYTNSTQIPVGYTDDPFTALNLQEELQKRYSGGTVIHLYMGEKVSSPEVCKTLVRRVLENYRVPYITITPTFSICPKHGYISGEHKYCPICDEELSSPKLNDCDACQ